MRQLDGRRIGKECFGLAAFLVTGHIMFMVTLHIWIVYTIFWHKLMAEESMAVTSSRKISLQPHVKLLKTGLIQLNSS